MCDGRICSLEKWNRMYTCCINYVPFCGEMCTISIPDVYVSYMSTKCDNVNTMCTRCTRINAVKGVDIRVQSYSNEMQWDEDTSEYAWIRMIVICRNFHQYIRYTWCILGEMSNIQATMCHMSYSSEIPSSCNAPKLCILFVHTKEKNLKIKGEINNHTVMII